MSKYHLTVIMPAANSRDQKDSVTVTADDMEISEAGCYLFTDEDGHIIASYPIRYTIISKIEFLG